MPSMNPLPPQAYTQQTLKEAYAWLMNQHESIKEMATTPDILVSLYLKAQRQGLEALERPSVQNFKNELKQLAGLMGDLDQNTQIVGQPTQTNSNQFVNVQPQHTQQHIQQPSSQVVQHSSPPVAPAQPQIVVQQTPQMSGHISADMTASLTASHQQYEMTKYETTKVVRKTSDSMAGLDTKTWAMIHEVKEGLNLSSDQEALRMLVTLGYKGAKKLLE